MTVIDPSFLTSGPEWSVGLGDQPLEAPAGAGAAGEASGSFGSMLTEQIGNLEQLQADAAEQSRALATGTATDPAEVVVAVERARLAMQLAAQLRTKGVEAINDVMRTQV